MIQYRSLKRFGTILEQKGEDVGDNLLDIIKNAIFNLLVWIVISMVGLQIAILAMYLLFPPSPH
jgi:hypothetical protein